MAKDASKETSVNEAGAQSVDSGELLQSHEGYGHVQRK
jgi:hypothetical protein